MTYANVFIALADPTRRHIFEALRTRSKTVGEIADEQPVSRPAVSQHLKVLESANLVNVEPKGNRRIYSINRDGLEEARKYIDTFWSDILTAYSDEVLRQIENNPEPLVGDPIPTKEENNA